VHTRKISNALSMSCHQYHVKKCALVDVWKCWDSAFQWYQHRWPTSFILWTIVQIWNSPAVCQPCSWLRRRLSPGSACRAHATR